MNYRPDIDGLRAVAVVPVVLFHTELAFSGGFVGVDVFFVISGFLITTILWNDLSAGRYSLVGFYERRIRRIFPALFSVLAVSTVLALALMLPPHLLDFSESAVATTGFLSNVYFFLKHGYFTEAAHLKPLLHTWSLAVEEQYYIVFPVLLWGLYRLHAGASTPILAWLTAIAAASLATAVMTVRQDPVGAAARQSR